jgi:hypothetical protein
VGRRLQSTADALRQWESQYERGFFTYWDYERNRGFTGRFMDEHGTPQRLTFTPEGFNHVTIKGKFTELPNVAMQTYPTNWGVDSIFMEERDDFGNDLVKLTGSGWAYGPSVNHHGGAAYQSNVLNDTAEWLYFGYGVRIWSAKDANSGILEYSITLVNTGGVLGPSNVDLYSAATTGSAPITTNVSLGLGLYRVKLRCTHTKNAASGGFFVYADAIEVMR